METSNQLHQYIKELYRVFLHNNNPTNDEIQVYIDEISTGRSLDDVESEFKLQSLNVLK